MTSDFVPYKIYFEWYRRRTKRLTIVESLAIVGTFERTLEGFPLGKDLDREIVVGRYRKEYRGVTVKKKRATVLDGPRYGPVRFWT